MPFFAAHVTADQHDKALQNLCVSADRADMRALRALIPAGGQIPFGQWWREVKKCKSAAQWLNKFHALGFAGDSLEGKPLNDLGASLYRHLSQADTWSERPSQQPPADIPA